MFYQTVAEDEKVEEEFHARLYNWDTPKLDDCPGAAMWVFDKATEEEEERFRTRSHD